jgi:toxin ParE1/3/4
MKEIIFLDPAKEEMADAAEFYDLKASGLGEEFLQEIESVIKIIKKYPESGKLLNGKIRRRITGRFPFGVLYVEEENEIIVIAIMHLKRRPGYWTKRLKRN